MNRTARRVAVVTLVAAFAGALPGPGVAKPVRSDLPSMQRVARAVPALEGAHRFLDRDVSLGVPMKDNGHAGPVAWCDYRYRETKSALGAWYGEGENYVDVSALALEVFDVPSAKRARSILSSARRNLAKCLGKTFYADGQRAHTYRVATPASLGGDRYAFRVSNSQYERYLTYVVRHGSRILQVVIDGDNDSVNRSWRWKRHAAIASMRLLRVSAR